MSEKSSGLRLFWIITFAVVLGIMFSEALRSAIVAIIAPFVIAYVVAKLTRPFALAVSRRCRVSEKIGCTVCGVLICFAVGYSVTNLSWKLWEQLSTVTTKLPVYAEEVTERVADISVKVTSHLPFLDGEGEIGNIVNGAFREAVSEIGSNVAVVLGSAVSEFPGGILSVFIAIIAYLYLIADMDGAGKSLRKVVGCFFSENITERVFSTLGELADSVFVYLRTYALLMIVTFAELSIGFSIIGAQNPFAVALVTALIDALPLFGCGIIIVPWALWCFLEGETGRAIGLLLIQAIVYLVRQLVEPRLIGKMSGVHPFVALVVLFCGLKIGGVVGMICAPVLLMSVMRMKEQ